MLPPHSETIGVVFCARFVLGKSFACYSKANFQIKLRQVARQKAEMNVHNNLLDRRKPSSYLCFLSTSASVSALYLSFSPLFIFILFPLLSLEGNLPPTTSLYFFGVHVPGPKIVHLPLILVQIIIFVEINLRHSRAIGSW